MREALKKTYRDRVPIRLFFVHVFWIFGMIVAVIGGTIISLYAWNQWVGMFFTIPVGLFCFYKWCKNLVKIINFGKEEKKVHSIITK